MQVEVRLTKRNTPELDERGYAPFILLYWDTAADLLTSHLRDGMRPMRWSEVVRTDEITDQLSVRLTEIIRGAQFPACPSCGEGDYWHVTWSTGVALRGISLHPHTGAP